MHYTFSSDDVFWFNQSGYIILLSVLLMTYKIILCI